MNMVKLLQIKTIYYTRVSKCIHNNVKTNTRGCTANQGSVRLLLSMQNVVLHFILILLMSCYDERCLPSEFPLQGSD